MSKLKLSAQEGRALALTLIVLAIGCLLIPPFLAYISTNLFASYATEEGMKEQYAADAGVEYAVWKLINDRDFLELVSSSVGSPVSVEMPTSVNAIMPAVTVMGQDIPHSWPGRWGGQGTGGAGWQGSSYLDVYFQDEAVGWMVGDTGRIMKTYDGGYAWYQQSSTPGYPDLYSISRTITETWVVGDKGVAEGTVWHANDEDEEWYQIPEVPNLRLRSIFFVDALHGWAVGEPGTGNQSTILKTENGGGDWTQDNVESDPKKWLNSVFLVADNDGWAVGLSGTILHYDGVKWNPIPKPTNEDLNEVYFVDEDHGWIVGVGGTILKTWDGGANWHEQDDIEEPGEITTLNGISVVSTTIDATTVITGWVVGNDGNIRAMTKTITETNSWTLPDDWNFKESSAVSDLYSVYFTDATHGWAVGYSWTILLYTCDESGCGWFNPNRITDRELRSVWGADDGFLAWTVGDKTDIDGEPGEDWIIGVTQDGASWANVEPGQLPQPPTSTIQSLLGVSFAPDESAGWAVGANGTILKSTDGGGYWEQQTSSVLGNLNAVCAISSTLAYAVGDADGSGLILRTIDGQPWSRLNVGLPNQDLNDIDFFCDANGVCTGWAVGATGTVMKITNPEEEPPSLEDQTNAAREANGAQKPLYGVCAVYSDIVWAVGDNETIIVSSDGGDAWSAINIEELDTDVQLRAVDFATPMVGCIAGKKHSAVLTTLLRTTDGGASWTSMAKGAGRDLYDVFVIDICDGWAVGEDGIIMHFFCPNIGDTGGCGFFDIESVANDISTNSRVHLCLDGMHIDSWEIE